MAMQQAFTTEQWEMKLGEQIKAARLRANIDQRTLSLRAGISVGSLKNLESGKGATVKTLIRAVRALGLESWLLALLPPTPVDPFELLHRKKQERTKASPRRKRENAHTKVLAVEGTK